MRKAVAALVLVAASLAPAQTLHAQAGNMLAELGMLGRWAFDCRLPPGSGNAHTIFERTESGSGAQYRVVFAQNQSTTRSIDNVRIVSENTIAMRFTTVTGASAGLGFDITMLKEPKRYRVIASVGTDGKTYIKDGKVVDTGAENPWQQFCGKD